jgi:hypothetical protein
MSKTQKIRGYSKKKKIFFNLISFIVGSLLTFVLGELFFSIFGYIRYGTVDISQLLEKEKNNTFITDLPDKNSKKANTYMDTLYPHPYLAHVHRWGNNIGLFGHDFPFLKKDDQFVILVSGGSVACQFAGYARSRSYLEEMLNQRYDFEGKQVIVLNGGDGAWKHPQQIIMFLLYADVIDAFITLDGFNEHYFFKPIISKRLEYPSSNFHHVNPIIKGGYKKLLAAWITSTLYNYSRNNWLISHSRLVYFLTRYFRETVQKAVYAEKQKKDDSINVESIFSIPDNWSQIRKFQFNIKQYQKYIKMMARMAQPMDIKYAFFIQPVPAIGKKLTVEERGRAGDLKYRYTYQKMTDELLKLRDDENIPIYSLLNIFNDCNDTLYADSIHCISSGSESKGYKIMTERILLILEKEWGMKKN